MFVIIGDQSAKDETGRHIQGELIFDDLGDSQVILDTKDIEFGFTKLSQCRLLDVYKFLSCKKKTLNPYQRCYLTSSVNVGFLKKTDFYLQEVSLHGRKNKIINKHNIFLVENIVAELCKRLGHLRDNDWWLYAAKHEVSGTRIIAGVGRCIVLSRFLENDQSIQDDISQSLFYLRRCGLNIYPKIFTTFDGVDRTTKRIDLNRIHKQLHIKWVSNMDSAMMEFLISNSKVIKPIFSLDVSWKDLANSHNSLLMWFVSILFVCFIFLAGLIFSENKTLSKELEEITAYGKNIQLKITEHNFKAMEQVVQQLKQSWHPLIQIQKVMEICAPYNITINEICLEQGRAKIKATVDAAELNSITSNKLISIDKTSVALDEFEGLLTNKTVSVVICVKIN